MANSWQLEPLKQGVEAWNKWRSRHLGVQRPDLTRADLVGANLQGADLNLANLQGANLQGADLQGADLMGARLQGADLRNANLLDAKLGAANLQGADLRNANLASADLSLAILARADLQGANLQDTNLHECLVADSLVSGFATEALAYSGIRWSRVFAGPYDEFDDGSNWADSSYWLFRQGDETIREACHRAIQAAIGTSDDITVEFTRSVWRELYLVELGLREALGENSFDVTRSDDRISVTFGPLLEEKLTDPAVRKVTHFNVTQLFRRSRERFELLGKQRKREGQ